MHRYLVLLGLATMVAACNNGTDATDEADTDTDTDADCDNGIVSTYPASDDTGVYYRTDIEIAFQKADEGATATLSTGGTEVSTTPTWRDKTLVLTHGGLEPSTTYDLAIDYECGNPAISFTTSDVGAPIADPATLNDSVFTLDLASGNFVKPAGVGALLQQQLTVDILIGVSDADGTDLQMIGALGAEGATPPVQDMCQESIDFPTADFSGNPFFSVGPQTTTLSVQGIDITIDDLFVSGAFAPDASSIQGAVLKGSVDTRPLVPLLDPEGDDDTICAAVSAFNVSCEECTDPPGAFCLELEINRIGAEGNDIDGLLEVSAEDIAADSSCTQ